MRFVYGVISLLLAGCDYVELPSRVRNLEEQYALLLQQKDGSTLASRADALRAFATSHKQAYILPSNGEQRKWLEERIETFRSWSGRTLDELTEGIVGGEIDGID